MGTIRCLLKPSGWWVAVAAMAALAAGSIRAQEGAAGAAAASNAVVSAVVAQPATAGGGEDGMTGGQALVAKFQAGGWSMYVQLALSIVAVAVTLERAVHLRRSRFLPAGAAAEVHRLWGEGDFAGVGRYCESRPSVFTRIVQFLAEHRDDDPELLAREAEELGQEEMWLQLQRTRPLSVVATLSPLLGLFGTVQGMIESFDTVALMGELGDASMLASGISKALITTAAGLIIAIPSLGLYYYLRGRAEVFAHLVGTEVTDLFREHIRRKGPVRERAS